MRRGLLGALVALMALMVLVWPASAQLFPTPAAEPKPSGPQPPQVRDAWLDEPKRDWNTPGMTIPAAPANSSIDPFCIASMRPSETTEDAAVMAAGWSLSRPYRAAWGIKVIYATASTGGMCRSEDYNEFVFADDTFIGTIAPYPMRSISGSPGSVSSWMTDSMTVDFVRYRPSDSGCCPSGTPVRIVLKIERGAASAVLRRE